MLKYVFICMKESVIALTIFSNKFTLWQYKNLRQSHKNTNYSYCQTKWGSVKKRHFLKFDCFWWGKKMLRYCPFIEDFWYVVCDQDFSGTLFESQHPFVYKHYVQFLLGLQVLNFLPLFSWKFSQSTLLSLIA